jgi:hypothetical protein
MRLLAETSQVDFPDDFAIATFFLTDPFSQQGTFAAACNVHDLPGVLFRGVPDNHDAPGSYVILPLAEALLATTFADFFVFFPKNW